MKAINFLRAAILLIGILLSACAPAANSSAPANVGGGKPLSEVIFTGVIESMNGDQWVINGQTIQVDSSIQREGPFVVGDTVKVEASVGDDGSVIAQRVESPSAADLVEATTSTPDGSSPLPGASSTPQAPASNDNSNDNGNDNGNEAFGTVDAVTDTSITVDGQTFTFASGVEIKGEIVPGAVVKLHFMVNADGTLSVREIEIANPTLNGNDNSNDDNSNGNSNDDDSNDDNSNSNSNDDDHDDDNSNDSNSNDDDDDDDHDDDNSNDSNSNG